MSFIIAAILTLAAAAQGRDWVSFEQAREEHAISRVPAASGLHGTYWTLAAKASSWGVSSDAAQLKDAESESALNFSTPDNPFSSQASGLYAKISSWSGNWSKPMQVSGAQFSRTESYHARGKKAGGIRESRYDCRLNRDGHLICLRSAAKRRAGDVTQEEAYLRYISADNPEIYSFWDYQKSVAEFAGRAAAETRPAILSQTTWRFTAIARDSQEQEYVRGGLKRGMQEETAYLSFYWDAAGKNILAKLDNITYGEVEPVRVAGRAGSTSFFITRESFLDSPVFYDHRYECRLYGVSHLICKVTTSNNAGLEGASVTYQGFELFR